MNKDPDRYQINTDPKHGENPYWVRASLLKQQKITYFPTYNREKQNIPYPSRKNLNTARLRDAFAI